MDDCMKVLILGSKTALCNAPATVRADRPARKVSELPGSLLKIDLTGRMKFDLSVQSPPFV